MERTEDDAPLEIPRAEREARQAQFREKLSSKSFTQMADDYVLQLVQQVYCTTLAAEIVAGAKEEMAAGRKWHHPRAGSAAGGTAGHPRVHVTSRLSRVAQWQQISQKSCPSKNPNSSEEDQCLLLCQRHLTVVNRHRLMNKLSAPTRKLGSFLRARSSPKIRLVQRQAAGGRAH